MASVLSSNLTSTDSGVAYLCISLVVSSLAYFVVQNRKAIRAQLPKSVNQPVSKSSKTDYTTVFPPSQRHVLSDLDVAPGLAKEALGSAGQVLGFEDDYRRADDSRYVYSGFTVGEIKALGDFPDYAKLSGVPPPTPVADFNLDKSTPRPYRPFRWSYHQTMSLQKLEPDYWLELENTYRERIKERQQLYANHGKQVLDALPGSELACKELMEMAVQFLCARYPKHFELSHNVLSNHILGTKHDLKTQDPLRVLLDNVPEDFALTIRDPATGRYFFRAGVICSAMGWTLGAKMGLDLQGIHEPVPDYKQNMAFSMDRFFTKMPTSSPIQRGSWGIEIGQPLYLPADHPDFDHRKSQNPDLTPEDLFLRVDWQTLRRLPLSGAIVFNFKALFTPLTGFKDEPYIPSLVLKVLNEGKENIMKYKGTWHVEHVAKPALEAYEKYQVENGLMKSGWSPQTLDEAPFFPGWERKHVLALRPTANMALQASLEKAKLVPGSAETLIPKDFQPTTTLKVDFGGKAVELGNLLRVSEVKTAPSVSFAAEVKPALITSLTARVDIFQPNASPSASYLLLLVDPDAPTPDDPKFAFWRHWVLPGLQPLSSDNAVAQTKHALTESAPHRYLLLLFREPPSLDLAKEDVGGEEFVQRRSFKAAEFVEKNKLTLVGVNWFLGAGDGWKE
ncbi:hypothetical protein S40293_01732 [Stachybotrys chartarum IBT 40293]|nr:hypothetical protein S40293_01732 [Stachybotrys chartarum IBT 40293]